LRAVRAEVATWRRFCCSLGVTVRILSFIAMPAGTMRRRSRAVASEDQALLDAIARSTRDDPQLQLLDVEPDWRSQWWGMPRFEMGDAQPQHKVTINFLTTEDLRRFAELTGITLSSKTDSAWFPNQKPLTGQVEWHGQVCQPRYPICIPSKGRATHQKTGKALDKMGIDYLFFVEETEGEEYARELGQDRVVVMPFHDLGKGSIPARNFIWEWAKEQGHKRHWTVDDNIKHFARTTMNRRLVVRGGGLFNAMEDFVDRYENIAMAGPHGKGFVPDRQSRPGPYLLNSRVYSCILLDTTLPHRWRGRYNEDTDLSLRILKDGHCTLLFRAFTMDKIATVGGRDEPALPGGNTDNVYNGGDRRRAFADSLRDQHPDVVKVVWKWKRWHHQVDYSPFRRNTPILCPNIVPLPEVNEYGMRLARSGGE